MRHLKRTTLLALALLVALAAIFPALGQDEDALIRFVHAIPGASAVDVYTDGQLTVSDLGFGGATNYIHLPSGDHTITVTETGATTPLWEQRITAGSGAALTLVASSVDPLEFAVFADDLNPLPIGRARLTAIHAIEDAPTVDILLADGRPVIPGLAYNQPYGTLDLPSLTYELAIVPAGEALDNALVEADGYTLNSGAYYIALLYGTSNDPQTLLVSAPTRPQSAGGHARFVHGLADAAAVDIYLDETLVVTALEFGNSTEFAALPEGEYAVSVRASGETTELATGTLTVSADEYANVVVLGTAEAPELSIIPESLEGIDAETALVSVINAASEAVVRAALEESGDELLAEVAAGSAEVAAVGALDDSIIIDRTTDETSDSTPLDLPSGIYGGVLYTVLVIDDGVFQLDPVSIAQGIASAPGDATLAVAEATVEATTEATPEATPLEPILPTATPQAAAPTPAPTQAAGPTAVVLLDPGANLHLRQYPSADALSLGLAPSGTILRVNGREGAPAVPLSATPTPEGTPETPWIDPVSQLEEGQDLNPVETWLYVTYDTPDGGEITAWVNAQFVGLRNAQGQAMLLRNLPTVPGNQAGQASNTSIQPPSPNEQRVTITIAGVDPGVSVHIRRTPSAESESLARVVSGTILDYVGITEEQDWVFVRYTTPEGGIITGWVSAQFATYQRNDQAVDLERLQALGELNTLTGEERGAVQAAPPGDNVTPTATPLRNVIVGEVVGLNPTASLHLRRNPSTNAESLALLPNGTQLIVTGRTLVEDRQWLEVTYEGQPGWVAADFISLTFNGLAYSLEQVPLIDLGASTAEATGEATAPAT